MNLDKKLSAYVAGAAAAAAAGLVGADSAEAVIVSSPGFNFGAGSTTNINFDNAGNEEYVLGHRTGPNRVQLLKDDQTLDANAYVLGPDGDPAALPLNTLIGPASTFDNDYDANLANLGDGSGNFLVDNITGNPQYLGLRFQLADGGPQFYGWIGVDITDASNLAGQVTGFAYQDSGAAIRAGELETPGGTGVPEPVGLGSLAMGAAGIAAFRRRRREA